MATASSLVSPELLGLGVWLSGIGAPEVMPECSCGNPRQTIQQVLKFCPNQIEAQIEIPDRTGHTQINRLLRKRDIAKWAGQ